MLVATLPVLGGFVGYERHVVRRGRSPLVALHLFRVATVTLGLVVSVAFFSSVGVFSVLLTLVFQAGFGYSAFAAGLLFLPCAVGFAGGRPSPARSRPGSARGWSRSAPAAAVTGARQGAPASSVGNEVTGNGPARGHWRKEVTRVTHIDGPAHNGEREVSARCTMTMRAGVRAGACKADQGDAAQVDGLVTVGVQRCGHLDILVNTAGVLVTGSDEGKGTKDEEASWQSGHCDGRIEGDRHVDCHASGSRRRCSRCQLCDEQSGR